jgi:transcriptional regulator with XRE-family HTH domain
VNQLDAKMFTIVNEFVEWLQGELNKRDWSQADLARVARVSKSSISMIYSHDREPGSYTG